MIIKNFPTLRQTYNYDCGANAVQSILVYYGIEIREDILIKKLKTTKDGTSINNIVSFLNLKRFKIDSRKMSIEDLKFYLNKKIPVLLVLQAWKYKNILYEKDYNDGHYVVAIGYLKNKIIFEDPSSFKRAYLFFNELEKRWHDVDVNGKKYYHHGIAVFGKTPKYVLNSLVHLD
jgi:predicted double-glycine peptidase